MAKQQTFGDKVKKKKQESLKINVRVLKGVRSDKDSLRILESFVQVDDLNELEKLA